MQYRKNMVSGMTFTNGVHQKILSSFRTTYYPVTFILHQQHIVYDAMSKSMILVIVQYQDLLNSSYIRGEGTRLIAMIRVCRKPVLF